MTDQNIVFKNSKTGKVDTINASDMDFVNFQRMLDTYGIRIFMKNGSLHRFSGFKDAEQEKIAAYFKNNYKQEMLEKELSLRGWNWGTAQFNGSLLSFNVENKTSFEVPLNAVSQCTPGKNEVTLEFHQDDEGPVSLMEMRFHIPTTETAETDPVDAFQKNVMDKASVISVSGDAIAIFREIHCLTPRFVDLSKKFRNYSIDQLPSSFSEVATTSKSSRPSSNSTARLSTTRSPCPPCCDSSCCRTRTTGRCSSFSLWIRRSNRARRGTTTWSFSSTWRTRRASSCRSPRRTSRTSTRTN